MIFAMSASHGVIARERENRAAASTQKLDSAGSRVHMALWDGPNLTPNTRPR